MTILHICTKKPLTHAMTYILKMTRQGGSRGAARDLTADPDFIMRETNSPLQGTKMSRGNITTSTDKKNKLAPKESTSSTRQFWFDFEIMEKLAVEEGAPLSFTPTPIHTLIRNDFSDKETREFLESVLSYPHVNQSCFPLCRPEGIPGQKLNLTQLP